MATTTLTVRKALAGAEDINWDEKGDGGSAVVAKSDGSYRTTQRVNASHLPITAATRSKTTADGTTVESGDVDGALQEVFEDLAAIGIPDGTILVVSGGTLQIAAGSITNAKMAANSIDSDQYVDGSIDSAHFAAGAVDANAIATGAVGSDELATNAVTAVKINDNAVTNDKILDGTVKAAKFADAHTHFIVGAEEITSSTTGTTSLLFTTTTTIGASDIIQVTAKSFGTGPVEVRSASRTGANQVTAVVDANQTAGSTVLYLTVFKAVSV